MKIRRLLLKLAMLLSVIIPFVISSMALSATYYLDATNGNDSNSGTSELTSWKTIGKVNASAFFPGDQILFKRGAVWREQLLTSSAGNAANFITFGSYGTGNRPVISALDLIVPGSSWTLDSANIWKTTVPIQPKVVVFDSVLGITVTSKAALDADYKWWWSSNVLYVYSVSTPDTRWLNPGVQVGARPNAINITKNYITLDNLEVQGANTSWMGNVHMESNGVNHFIMQNCESKWGCHGFAIGPRNGGSNTVRDCLFHHNLGYGISSDTDTGPTSTTQNYFQRNEVYNNLGDGIHIDANYWVVEYNRVHDNGINIGEYIGIHLYTASVTSGAGHNNVIRYNAVYNQKGAANDGAGIAVDQWCDNNQIYYNICYGNDGPGFYNYDAIGNSFDNNVAYGNCQNSSGGLTMKSEFRLTGTRTNNVILKNDIGYATLTNTYAIYLSSETYGAALSIANNDWFSVAGNWFYYNATPGTSLTAWNTMVGGGTDIHADPKFVNPATDLHLQSGSVCIGVGVNVGLTEDYEGTSVSGAVTIGAYQYSPKPQTPANFRIAN